MTLLITDAEELPEHLLKLNEFLLDFEDAIRELQHLAIPCRINCGLTVGTDDHFTRTFTLSPKLMQRLADLDVGFAVSAYPCSD